MWDNETLNFLTLAVSMFVLTNIMLRFLLMRAIKELREEGFEPSIMRMMLLVGMVNIILSVYCGTVMADTFDIR